METAVTVRRLNATAVHHEKISRAFESVGRTRDAAVARYAASKCRAEARAIEEGEKNRNGA